MLQESLGLGDRVVQSTRRSIPAVQAHLAEKARRVFADVSIPLPRYFLVLTGMVLCSFFVVAWIVFKGEYEYRLLFQGQVTRTSASIPIRAPTGSVITEVHIVDGQLVNRHTRLATLLVPPTHPLCGSHLESAAPIDALDLLSLTRLSHNEAGGGCLAIVQSPITGNVSIPAMGERERDIYFQLAPRDSQVRSIVFRSSAMIFPACQGAVVVFSLDRGRHVEGKTLNCAPAAEEGVFVLDVLIEAQAERFIESTPVNGELLLQRTGVRQWIVDPIVRRLRLAF